MSLVEQALQMAAAARWDESRRLLELHLRRSPQDLKAMLLLTRTLLAQSDRTRAAYHAERVGLAAHADVPTRLEAAELLQAAQEPVAGERVVREAARRTGWSHPLRAVLINMLRAQGRVGEAGDAALEGGAAFGADATRALIGAGALGESLRSREATALVRAAAGGGDSRIRRAVASMLLYSDEASASEIALAHAAAGESLASEAARLAPFDREKWAAARGRFDAGEFRVAIVSPDLRDHAVARFLAGFVSACKADASVRLVGVDLWGRPDETTRKMRGDCAEWIEATGLPDLALLERVRQAACDVVLDLASLHVTGRPLVIAARAAPVQVSWLGYAHAGGMRSVDARLVDSITDPDEGAWGVVSQGAERALRLDRCFLAFTPDERTPSPVRVEPPHPGEVVFASFNAAQKITASTLDWWARVLCEVEGSSLLLKSRALSDARTTAILHAEMQRRGVDASRVRVEAHRPGYREHLEVYQRVDVALDTMPYNGTTTTCEALSMGVPVVTVAGERHAARVGASLLAASGVERVSSSCVAGSMEEGVRLAQRHAAAVRGLGGEERSRRRREVRDALLASPLCDAAGHAAAVITALRSLRVQPGSGHSGQAKSK